ncbi:ATP synthase F1 subunit gamma [Luteolibacter yonseiensis]|uniref:ATP synthase gamma chain n=1 Tax=Luteolibacter yonseiensis TaxID=1144680 RepID=A0A934VCC3_9BACT|nr:ATP synthase F1 subunit gamma [Luteolibacter yonseiensis]MBK1816324.1 ATP synthase F1 subunit gamma [Luteolibacter yonseiensis]
MANLRDIRRRIKSVKNTAQITRAMQLVAAAKMKKAQDQALAGREYAKQLSGVLQDISESFSEATHALLEKRAGNRELVIVISTDKGLCGAINTNLAKVVRRDTSATAEFVTIGRKLRVMLEKQNRKVVADFTVKDPVPFSDARSIASLVSKLFLDGSYDKVSVAYTRFVNTMNQVPEVVQLLPVEPPTDAGEHTDTNDFLFEPTPEDVLSAILPLYVNFRVFQSLVEARASEHSARMVAMKSATDNAKKFIKELTLEYNKLRQGAITAELLEITTAMKAME